LVSTVNKEGLSMLALLQGCSQSYWRFTSVQIWFSRLCLFPKKDLNQLIMLLRITY